MNKAGTWLLALLILALWCNVALAEGPDLSARLGAVEFQSEGECVGYALAYVVEIATGQGLNGAALYRQARPSHRTQPGITVEEGASLLTDRVTWSRGVEGNLEAVKAHLDAGHPVVLTVQWYAEWYANWRAAPARPAGIHAITLVGYDTERAAFRYVNSYGPRWGEGGYAWWSFERFLSPLTREAWLFYAVVNDPWASEFARVHGRAPTAQDVADRQWSLAFAQQYGRPPSQQDWERRYREAR